MADVKGNLSAFEIALGGPGEPLDVAALGIRTLPTLWRSLCPGRACPLAPEGDAVIHGVDLDPDVTMRRMGNSGQLAMALLLSGATSEWEAFTSVWATGSIHESGRLDTTLNGVGGKFDRFMDWVEAQPEGGRHLFLAPLGRADVVTGHARAPHNGHVHVFDTEAPFWDATFAPGAHVVFIPETTDALRGLIGQHVPLEDDEPPPPTYPWWLIAVCALIAILGALFATRGGDTTPDEDTSPIEMTGTATKGVTTGATTNVAPTDEAVDASDEDAPPRFDSDAMREALGDIKRQRDAGMRKPDQNIKGVVESNTGKKE